MSILRNPEAKKLFAAFAGLFLLFILLAGVFSLVTSRQFQSTAEQTHAAVVGAVIAEYPDAEQEVVRQILNADEEAVSQGQEILSRYGIYTDDIGVNTGLLQSNFRVTLLLFLLFSVLISGAFIVPVSKFLNRQYGEIQEVTRYAQKIESGDYSLDIRDNSEGDLSILKNEIYKITTTLKSQAALLQQEKIALADSMADISHQLKTPMTSMLVLNDILSREMPETEKKEFLARMKAQLSRLEWLVTSLLKLAKFDAGTVVMKKEQVLVGQLVEKAVAAMEIPLDIKMQQVQISGASDVSFIGDLNWSCEALINILKNCIEHTPERGRINISFSENPLFTEITITDSGVGIAKEDLPYLFNRFYKGKNAGDDSVGIGLAMAHTIVSRQGGDIAVQSEAGSGAQFTIKLYKDTATQRADLA
ncbi:sensor histidine kinase [Dethiobacter alkaliphilus]|uniref:histidine kinase n=1 Tax=Dethiobacter alkaliphilus AHT 1 TaxID=555088 RepID=C0GKV5_DETAL|nr:HAMP domain-containing sensor histidine kinase [Dethiobacter alkaliphilus]EEG76037.1 integral membrane sensor signal transduction histidine kinase [Dethiobacter alkaliphilus AHT 1]